jgi:hypothetical protein
MVEFDLDTIKPKGAVLIDEVLIPKSSTFVNVKMYSIVKNMLYFYTAGEDN